MQQKLIDAVKAMDQAVQQLATAYQDYSGTFGRASREAFETAGRGDRGGTAAFTLQQAVGPVRVHELLVRRLRGLGLGPLLEQARTPGHAGDEWVTRLTAAIERRVA